MIDLAEWLLCRVAWATTAMSMAYCFVSCLFRFSPGISHQTREFAWLGVIVLGVMILEVPIDIPWYDQGSLDSQTSEASAIVVHTHGILSTPPGTTSNSTIIQPPSRRSISNGLSLILLGVWAIGALVSISVSLIRCRKLIRCVIENADADTDDALRQEFSELLADCNFRGRCRLVLSQKIGPLVYWQPSGYHIVVPSRWWNQTDRVCRELILRHEIQHIHRLDILKLALARWMVALQWFNPLSWRALSKLNEAIEFACDRAVCGSDQKGRVRYSQSLLRLIEQSQNQSRHNKTTSAGVLYASGSSLTHRFEQILKPERKEMKMTRMSIATLFVLLVIPSVLRVNLVAQQTVPNRNPMTIGNLAPQSTGTENTTHSEKLKTVTYMVAGLVTPFRTNRTLFDGKQWTSSDETKNDRGFSSDWDSELVRLIIDIIDPDSWSTNGGPGRIVGHKENLSILVSQTQKNHDRIADLLSRLRELTEVSLLVEADLVILSEEVFNKIPIEFPSKPNVIKRREVQILNGFAHFQDSCKRVHLPAIHAWTGQEFQYEIAANPKGVHEFDGITLADFRFLAICSADRQFIRVQATEKKTVCLNVADKVENRKETSNVLSSTSQNSFVHSVPDGGFLAIDLSDHLVDPNDTRRPILLLHFDIRKWR